MGYGIYHGCHNTFVIGNYNNSIDYNKEAIMLCDKYKTDGLLLLRQNPLEMIFYNADGSRAPMCGNGLRCFVKYAYDNGYVNSKKFSVTTLGGIMNVYISQEKPFMVRVNLGKPIYDSKKIEINTTLENFINQEIYVLGNRVKLSSVYLGTHHTVVFVDDLDKTKNLGAEICQHPIFRAQTNVNFAKIINREYVKVCTYERGVGWTKACGTGASSVYAIGKKLGLLDDCIKAQFPGGVLIISEEDGHIIMEGPAVTIKEPSNE